MTEHTKQKDIEFAKAMAQMSDAIGEMTSALLGMATVAAVLIDVVNKMKVLEPTLGSAFPAPKIFTHDKDGNKIQINKEPE